AIVSYEHQGIELIETAAGYRFQTRAQDALWIARLFGEKPQKYSRAMLETTALIAYRQPITRGEIEDVRGVAVSSYIIKTLLERQWIRVVGHREVPGRPAMFATTKQFLDYFGLNSLTQMPTLDEIKNLEDINPQLDQANTGAIGVDKEASMDELVDQLRDETTQREADTYLDEELANDLKELDGVNKTIEVSFEAQRAVNVSEDDPDYEQSREKADSFEQMVKSFNDENPVKYDQPLPQLAEGFEEIAQNFENQTSENQTADGQTSENQSDNDQTQNDQTTDEQNPEKTEFIASQPFSMDGELSEQENNGLSIAGLMDDQLAHQSAAATTSDTTNKQPQSLSDNQQLQQSQNEMSQEDQMRIIEEKIAQQAALMAAQSLTESQEEDENE
ncbi:MAG: SMC-Scp complex subunit ScpB, partial [Saccharospirillaceae bacterium]|nr:SMC-Scp complex subunit ScpB [Saccharospirillaceae bacterium]